VSEYKLRRALLAKPVAGWCLQAFPYTHKT